MGQKRKLGREGGVLDRGSAQKRRHPKGCEAREQLTNLTIVSSEIQKGGIGQNRTL